MKSKLSKRFLAILLSCLLVMASFAGTFTVGAATDEDAIRAAFEEYVASTVLTGTGKSSTYSDAGLITYLAEKGYADVTIVGAGTTTPQSYLQHAQAGFITGVEGYENLFATKDGYVAVVLNYDGANIGCVATIPADVYGSTDIDTVSTDADFSDTDSDGTIDAYTGSAELVVLDKTISTAMTWGDNAANIKAIVVTSGQSFASVSGFFGTTKLPNLQAFRFESGYTASGDNYVFSGASKLTHIALQPSAVYALSNHFLNGNSSVVVFENCDKIERVGWAAINGTKISTFAFGAGRGTVWTDGASLSTGVVNDGVTPVFKMLHSGTPGIDGAAMTTNRWSATIKPIVYTTQNVYNAIQASTYDVYKNAEYRLIVEDLVSVAATVKAKTDSISSVLPDAEVVLTTIKTGLTLPDGYTLNWVDDTFAVASGKVTGTLALSDGTNTVKYDVEFDVQDPEGTIEEAFKAYVASTVFTTNGYSSTYSDAGLKAALLEKGHVVTVVDSYLKHSQSGFTTSVAGYEDLFEAQDGFVSVLLQDAEGTEYVLTATLPAYTYEHLDIDTISADSDFTDTNSDGYFDTYTGSAELVVIPGNVASTITWGTNAANIKAIVYKGSQSFDANFNTNATFGASKLANLLAFRMTGGSFSSSANINFFSGNNNLTHIALPEGGVYMLPNHFLNGRSGVVRIENMDGVERFGWASLNGTNLNTFEAGVNRGGFYTDSYCFQTKIYSQGVTPVIVLHHENPSVTGAGNSEYRWNNSFVPIIYCNETTWENVFASDVYGLQDYEADWRYDTLSTLKTAGAVQVKLAGLTELTGLEEMALAQITSGLTLDEYTTLAWVDGTFKVEGGKVTGTLELTDDYYTVPFAVSADVLVPETDLQDDFEEYVASTVFTTNGYSSTYNDDALMNYLWAKGHAVTLVDSYLQHAEAGFTTSVIGYENLFAAEDGYVAVLLKDAEGNQVGYTATIPAYTYKHSDIDTVDSYATNPDVFTLEEDVITAYNGTAEMLILDKKVSPTFTVANAAGVKVIVITSGQTFIDKDDNAQDFHDTANRFSTKFPNLLAIRFDEAGIEYGADNGMLYGATKLTHVSLPSGLYMIPHWFLGGASSLVRLDNDHVVERIGYVALSGTKLHTIEAGKDKGRFWTDTSSMYTAIGAEGVTPVIKLHHADPIVEGSGTGSARWNAAYPPIIYCNEATYNKVTNGTVDGLKIAADWRYNTPAIFDDAIKAQAVINEEIATVDGADILAAAQAVLSDGITASWVSYELDGMDGIGTMAITDGETTINLAYNELAVKMTNGASVRYDTPAGIRFATRVNGIKELEEAGYTVNVGTIVAITSALGDNEFTKEALTAAGVNYLNVKTNTWAEAGLTEFGNYDNLTLNVVYNIPASAYATDLSARTYVEVTKDGVTETWYSDYSELNNARNIREVAIKVYDDAPESVKGILDGFIG